MNFSDVKMCNLTNNAADTESFLGKIHILAELSGEDLADFNLACAKAFPDKDMTLSILDKNYISIIYDNTPIMDRRLPQFIVKDEPLKLADINLRLFTFLSKFFEKLYKQESLLQDTSAQYRDFIRNLYETMRRRDAPSNIADIIGAANVIKLFAQNLQARLLGIMTKYINDGSAYM